MQWMGPCLLGIPHNYIIPAITVVPLSLSHVPCPFVTMKHRTESHCVLGPSLPIWRTHGIEKLGHHSIQHLQVASNLYQQTLNTGNNQCFPYRNFLLASRASLRSNAQNFATLDRLTTRVLPLDHLIIYRSTLRTLLHPRQRRYFHIEKGSLHSIWMKGSQHVVT